MGDVLFNTLQQFASANLHPSFRNGTYAFSFLLAMNNHSSGVSELIVHMEGGHLG